MPLARSECLLDDARVRITLWTFAPGESTGQHRHELEYAVVPVTGGTFSVESADGALSEMTQQRGIPYFRTPGAVHDVTSTNDTEAVFLEVELKPTEP